MCTDVLSNSNANVVSDNNHYQWRDGSAIKGSFITTPPPSGKRWGFFWEGGDICEPPALSPHSHNHLHTTHTHTHISSNKPPTPRFCIVRVAVVMWEEGRSVYFCMCVSRCVWSDADLWRVGEARPQSTARSGTLKCCDFWVSVRAMIQMWERDNLKELSKRHNSYKNRKRHPDYRLHCLFTPSGFSSASVGQNRP